MATEKKNGLKPIGNGIFLQKPCVIFTEWLATVWSRLEPAHWNKTNDADFSINYIAITTDVQSLIKVSAKEMFHLCCKKSETRTSGFIEDTHKFANSRYMSLNNNLIAIFFFQIDIFTVAIDFSVSQYHVIKNDYESLYNAHQLI